MSHQFNGEVAVMWKLTAVNEHCAASSMGSNSSDMSFQGILTSQRLGIRYEMGNVGLILVHAINDDAQVLGRPLVCLVAMFCVLLTLIPTLADLPGRSAS